MGLGFVEMDVGDVVFVPSSQDVGDDCDGGGDDGDDDDDEDVDGGDKGLLMKDQQKGW